ncbi:hypothetical protein AB7008_43025 [Bradyrhizobium sp. 521_C7_N1_3]|uniref:hypothetical protein n=1 Tax=Bradyrhizobium sp. 521_C7_N1_3 TaxID=3240368 RepID=UPI003F88B510
MARKFGLKKGCSEGATGPLLASAMFDWRADFRWVAHRDPLHLEARLTWPGFVVFELRVAYVAIPVIRAVRADVAIRFRGLGAVRPTQQKLFAHLDEARAAIFAV